MNAKITIAGCMLVAAMNHASAAIVDVNTELRASASSEDPENLDLPITNERTATFSGYGSFSVSAEASSTQADVTARVQPHAINIETSFGMAGSPQGFDRNGTAMATLNFNLSEAGVWSAKPVARGDTSRGLREAVVSLLREGQEVYRQDCSQVLGQFFCNPYYGDMIPVPEYAGRSIELQQGDYTLLLTASEGTSANSGGGGDFEFDLQPVPVPAALPLFLSGLAALGLVGWRRR